MPDNVEETFQTINVEGMFPDDLDLEPDQVRKLSVNNVFQRTLSLLSALSADGQKTLEATTDGELRVAMTSSGLEEYTQVNGSASDTFAAADTYKYSDSRSRWDIMIENNDAIIQFRNPQNTAWQGNIVLLTGIHSIDLTTSGIRVKNRVAGSVTDYQIVSYY